MMSQISARRPDDLEITPAKIVRGIRRSFSVVMEWQDVEAPSRLTLPLGSGDMRKLAIRIREQPLNFMIVIHQSMAIAQNGQDLSRRGSKASGILLGEGGYSVKDQQIYTENALQEIETFSSQLKKDTASIHEKFRLLRSVVMDINMELEKVTTKRERSDFLVRLSRYLSKDVRACEELLHELPETLEDIVKTLNQMTRWWQNVEAEAKYLQRNGGSKLALEGNKIRLKDIGDSFSTLKDYFADYLAQLCEFYDENVRRLSESNQKYLDKVQDCADLILSKKGRLEPREK